MAVYNTNTTLPDVTTAPGNNIVGVITEDFGANGAGVVVLAERMHIKCRRIVVRRGAHVILRNCTVEQHLITFTPTAEQDPTAQGSARQFTLTEGTLDMENVTIFSILGAGVSATWGSSFQSLVGDGLRGTWRDVYLSSRGGVRFNLGSSRANPIVASGLTLINYVPQYAEGQQHFDTAFSDAFADQRATRYNYRNVRSNNDNPIASTLFVGCSMPFLPVGFVTGSTVPHHGINCNPLGSTTRVFVLVNNTDLPSRLSYGFRDGSGTANFVMRIRIIQGYNPQFLNAETGTAIADARIKQIGATPLPLYRRPATFSTTSDNYGTSFGTQSIHVIPDGGSGTGFWIQQRSSELNQPANQRGTAPNGVSTAVATTSFNVFSYTNQVYNNTIPVEAYNISSDLVDGKVWASRVPAYLTNILADQTVESEATTVPVGARGTLHTAQKFSNFTPSSGHMEGFFIFLKFTANAPIGQREPLFSYESGDGRRHRIEFNTDGRLVKFDGTGNETDNIYTDNSADDLNGNSPVVSFTDTNYLIGYFRDDTRAASQTVLSDFIDGKVFSGTIPGVSTNDFTGQTININPSLLFRIGINYIGRQYTNLGDTSSGIIIKTKFIPDAGLNRNFLALREADALTYKSFTYDVAGNVRFDNVQLNSEGGNAQVNFGISNTLTIAFDSETSGSNTTGVMTINLNGVSLNNPTNPILPGDIEEVTFIDRTGLPTNTFLVFEEINLGVNSATAPNYTHSRVATIHNASGSPFGSSTEEVVQTTLVANLNGVGLDDIDSFPHIRDLESIYTITKPDNTTTDRVHFIDEGFAVVDTSCSSFGV